MRGRSMEKILEIIRLNEGGLSDRMIHRALSVSRPVVKDYARKFGQQDSITSPSGIWPTSCWLTWSMPSGMTDTTVSWQD